MLGAVHPSQSLRNALTWPSCANNITLITYNLNNIHTPARALFRSILTLADSMYAAAARSQAMQQRCESR